MTAAPMTPAQLERVRNAGVKESHVQTGCVRVLTLLGWDVYAIGQRDARKTQTPGMSDLLAFHPIDGVLFVEVKRPIHKRKGDGLSDAQRLFGARARAAGGGTCARYLRIDDSVELTRELENIRKARPR